MKRGRRVFTGAFKAKVSIEALKERRTLAELSTHFAIHQNMITKWKQEFLERSSEIFETKAKEDNSEADKEQLFAKIGQLEMECDWLKKNLKKAGL